MNHHRPHRRRHLVSVLLVLATAGIGAVLAGCNSVPSSAAATSAAGQAVLTAVDDAFASSASADGTDLAPASVSTQSVGPIVVVRRADMHRERRLVSLIFDQQPDPTSAEAQVWVHITGTAQLWQGYPASGTGWTLVGRKPIDYQGTITFQVAKGTDGWSLTSVDSTGLSQGADAATVANVGFTPDPLLIGHTDNVGTAGLTAPDSSDAFLVVARGPFMAPHGVLGDNGVAPDATADDGTYTGYVWVGADARAGTHLAFVTALDYTKTIDLSQSDGSFLAPYTFTLHPVVVDLAAGE